MGLTGNAVESTGTYLGGAPSPLALLANKLTHFASHRRSGDGRRRRSEFGTGGDGLGCVYVSIAFPLARGALTVFSQPHPRRPNPSTLPLSPSPAPLALLPVRYRVPTNPSHTDRLFHSYDRNFRRSSFLRRDHPPRLARPDASRQPFSPFSTSSRRTGYGETSRSPPLARFSMVELAFARSPRFNILREEASSSFSPTEVGEGAIRTTQKASLHPRSPVYCRGRDGIA